MSCSLAHVAVDRSCANLDLADLPAPRFFRALDDGRGGSLRSLQLRPVDDDA
jgi:hypothetical protein